MEWTGILCLFLALLGDIQLIIIGTLPLIMPKVLWLTGTYISTMAGVIGAFIAAITSQLLKTTKETSNRDLIYIYSLLLRTVAICISGFFYLIAIILTIASLIVTSSYCGEFSALMLNYHTDCVTKALVDNIQFALQCCGGKNYKDWFEIDWGAYESRIEKQQNHRLPKTEKRISNKSPEYRNDAVPYSCCARSSPSACVHQNLFQLGVSTINQRGCDKKLHSIAEAYLWFEMVMYCTSLSLEIAILVLLRTQGNSKKRQHLNKGDEKFGEFYNNNLPATELSVKSTNSSKSVTSSKTRTSTSSKTRTSTSSKTRTSTSSSSISTNT